MTFATGGDPGSNPSEVGSAGPSGGTSSIGGSSGTGGATSAGAGAGAGGAPAGEAGGSKNQDAGNGSNGGGGMSHPDSGGPTIRSDAGPGTWEDVSPSGVDYTCSPNNYGFQSMDGAKKDAPKTLYVGTCNQGVWKTTNGGDSWFKASTGAGSIDGRNWSLVVDHSNSNIVYTLCGFGGRQGIWKSINGGVDWAQVQNNITQNDLSHVEMDPLDHQHLLVTEHSGNYDLWESHDGGATWTNKGHPWGGANTFVYFLGQDNAAQPSSNFWLGFAENHGLWRTENGGQTWTQVSTTLSRSHGGAGLYRATGGALYGSVNSTIGRSSDNGRTLQDLAAVGNLPTGHDGYAGIVGDGEHIWSMLENTGATAVGPNYWWTTPETADGRVWTKYNGQSFGDGPQSMVFDPVNRVVYASQWCSGVWRLRLP
jgi:hypothetical protein